MKNKRGRPSGIRANPVYVQVPKLRPKITHVAVTVPEQKPELAQVVVGMIKENMNANPRNKSAQAKSRPAKS